MQVCPVCSTEVSTSSGTGTTGCWLGWWMNWWMVLSFYYCVKTEKHQTINNMISDNCIVCYLLVIYYNLYIICCSWLATYLTFFMELTLVFFSFLICMKNVYWILTLKSIFGILVTNSRGIGIDNDSNDNDAFMLKLQDNQFQTICFLYIWMTLHCYGIIRQNECIVWSYKKRNSIQKNRGFVKHIEVVWLFARISILNT